jgi:hypothetical protein
MHLSSSSSRALLLTTTTTTTTEKSVGKSPSALASSSSSSSVFARRSCVRERRYIQPHHRGESFSFCSSSSVLLTNEKSEGKRLKSTSLERSTLLRASSSGVGRGRASAVRTKASSSSSSEKNEKMKKDAKVDYGRVGVAFAFPALAGLLFGLDIGISSGALESIKSSSTDFFSLTASQSGQVVSASLFGALTASAVAAAGAGEKLGSRKEIALAGLLYLIGGTMEANAHSVDFLIVAKAVYGLGIGFAMHGAPVYIAETAPSSLRGTLISLKEAAIVFGILSGYFCASQYVGEDGGWRTMFLSSVPLALLTLVGAGFILPDSPRWLASKNTDSFPALKKLRGPNVSEMELMN